MTTPRPKRGKNTVADTTYRLGWGMMLVAMIGSVLLAVTAFHRLHFETDIIRAMPTGDPVIASAREVMAVHPSQDMFVVDVTLAAPEQSRLLSCGRKIESALTRSGLFRQVGLADMRRLFPRLVGHVIDYLPVLLSAADLTGHIAPLITPAAIRTRLAVNLHDLQQMDGIGQARWMQQDPLGFRNIVLAKLAGLMPGKKARFHNGFLMTAARDHLLITAMPRGSGTDTRFARQADALIQTLTTDLNRAVARDGDRVLLTAVGAWRAALDNERMARADTKRAIFLATAGIIILLLFAFPRPYLGVFALLPALFGTTAALFTYSLFFPSISMLSVGFGGAIVSITVDHGIAFLLFLDRPVPSTGRQAAREVWAVGLLAAATTVGAFLSLVFSGFPLLTEIGIFAALGMGFSFVFVHTIFPAVFKQVPPAARPRPRLLENLGNRLVRPGRKTGWVIALVLFLALAGFAWPRFNINLRALNSVTPATRAAEKSLAATWGDFSNRIFLTLAAPDIDSLRDRADRFTFRLATPPNRKMVTSGLILSILFPGRELARARFAAWQQFWTPRRVAAFKQATRAAAAETGFTDALFTRLFRHIDTPDFSLPPLPDDFFELAGILTPSDHREWIMAATLSKTAAYRPSNFQRLCSDVPSARLFDPLFFAHRLGRLLSSTFVRMILILGAGAILLLLVFFRSVKLTAIALSPLVFALVCSLGTLRLMGRALDIPSLMLSIVIIGMGIDYALYMVRAYQRYPDESSPESSIVRLTILLAAASTLMGFGAMGFADHRMLQSAGIATSLGIGYTLFGTFTLLPPLLRGIRPPAAPGGRSTAVSAETPAPPASTDSDV